MFLSESGCSSTSYTVLEGLGEDNRIDKGLFLSRMGLLLAGLGSDDPINKGLVLSELGFLFNQKLTK